MITITLPIWFVYFLVTLGSLQFVLLGMNSYLWWMKYKMLKIAKKAHHENQKDN